VKNMSKKIRGKRCPACFNCYGKVIDESPDSNELVVKCMNPYCSVVWRVKNR